MHLLANLCSGRMKLAVWHVKDRLDRQWLRPELEDENNVTRALYLSKAALLHPKPNAAWISVMSDFTWYLSRARACCCFSDGEICGQVKANQGWGFPKAAHIHFQH